MMGSMRTFVTDRHLKRRFTDRRRWIHKGLGASRKNGFRAQILDLEISYRYYCLEEAAKEQRN